MTQDEIVEMAKQAGWHDDLLGVSFVLPMLETFAKLVAAKAIAELESQEPVAYLCEPDENGLFGLPTPDKSCKDCFPVYRHPQRTEQEPMIAFNAEVIGYVAPQSTWVGLSEDELERLIHNFGNDPHTLLDEADARLRSRNT